MTRSDMQCTSAGFDLEGTMKALSKFSYADQCLLRQIMTGAVTPAAVLHKQNKKNDCKCPYCGAAVEDLWHRWWECSAWALARRSHPRVMARRYHMTRMKARFGLMPHTNDIKSCRRSLLQRTEEDLLHANKEDIRKAAHGHTTHTDGSVHNNSTPWATATMGMVSDRYGPTAGLALDGLSRVSTEPNSRAQY